MELKNKRIVFAGDSITDMNRGRNEKDLNHIYGHSYVFLLASGLGYEHPEDNMTFINRGISSNTSLDLLQRWESDVLSQKPDVISLLVGVNDINAAACEGEEPDLQTYRRNLEEMYRMAIKANPETQFIVCEPFVFAELTEPFVKDYFVKQFPALQQEARNFARRIGAVFVPLQSEFDRASQRVEGLGRRYWIWDGVHPTAAGHKIIENQWMKYVFENK